VPDDEVAGLGGDGLGGGQQVEAARVGAGGQGRPLRQEGGELRPGPLRRAGGLGERGVGRRAAFGASFSFLGSDWRTATRRRGAGILSSTCSCHAN